LDIASSDWHTVTFKDIKLQGKEFESLSYLFFLVGVAGLPVVSAAYPAIADNIAYNVLVEYNSL